MPGSEQTPARSRLAFVSARVGPVGRLHVFVLAAAALGVFAGSLWAGFTYDDYRIVLGDHPAGQFHWRDLWLGWGRSVRALTFVVDHVLFDRSPAGYHLHSLLWHALSVVLVYATLRRLSGRPALAFWGALVFAVHPIHVEAVANVANRKEPLCLAFSLLVFLAYARALETSGARRAGWLGVALVAWHLALNSKQVAAVLPVALVAYELMYLPRDRRLLARHPVGLAAGGAVAAALLLVAVSRAIDVEHLERIRSLAGYRGEPTWLAFGLTSARAFWRYVGLLVYPAGLCPDHEVELSASLADPWALGAWAALLGLAGLALGVAPRRPLLGFGLLWMLIHYLPVSNLIPGAYVLAERYMYIPSVGFCIALAAAGDELGRRLERHRPRLGAAAVSAVALVVVTVYAARTVQYCSVWRDERALWTHALACNPRSFHAHQHLGLEAMAAGLPDRALEHFHRMLELNPTWLPGIFNVGRALTALERYEEAEREYDRGLELVPDYPEGYYERARIRTALGRHDLALEDYTRAIELMPGYADAYTNRGNLQLGLGRVEAALEDYEAALRADPSHPDAHNNRGSLYLRLGRLDEAQRDYEAAVQANPSHPDANYNLAVLYVRRGRYVEGERRLERAAALGIEEAATVLGRLRAARQRGAQN